MFLHSVPQIDQTSLRNQHVEQEPEQNDDENQIQEVAEHDVNQHEIESDHENQIQEVAVHDVNQHEIDNEDSKFLQNQNIDEN